MGEKPRFLFAAARRLASATYWDRLAGGCLIPALLNRSVRYVTTREQAKYGTPKVLPLYVPHLARPLSHVLLFSNGTDERSANAPAAMYFVISVLPISITSGELPPASVASNFWRWSPQFWYCTSTVQPGWSCWNCAVAAATTSGQPDCASVCSQTVSLLACRCRPLAPAVAATLPRTTSRAAARSKRSLIELSY